MSQYRHIANLKGPAGDQGDTGATPDLAIGTVRTVTDPLEAGATLRGTPEDPILDLDLPRGLAAPDTAPTDESVAGFIDTQGTYTHGALTGVVEDQVGQLAVDLVRGMGVRRVVATTDAEQSIVDGDLLVLVDTPRYFTDFSSYEVGGTPHDWTPRWAEAEWWVQGAQSATAGRVLRTSNTDQGRRAITWDALSADGAAHETVEVVYKWRGTESYTASRALAYASGLELADATGIFGGRAPSNETDMVGVYLGGSNPNSSFGSVTTPYPPGDWWVTRFRIEDRTWSGARTWKWGTPEPQDWDATDTYQGNLDPGHVGLISFGSPTTDFDWVGVAFDGGRAPMGG